MPSFKEENILNTPAKNAFADMVYQILLQYYGSSADDTLMIAGSVAKNMQGVINTDPKDLDLITRDKRFFEFCRKDAKKIFKHFFVKNIGRKRVYIDAGFFSIEIWLDLSKYETVTINNFKIKNYA